MHQFENWVVALCSIEGKLGRTLIGQVVGYYMGNQNHFRSGGLPHLQLEILGPLVSRLVFKPELEMDSEKCRFHRIWGLRDVGYSHEFGFGFYVGLTPLLLVSK